MALKEWMSDRRTELEEYRDSELKKLQPLYDQRDALIEKIQPLENELRELQKQIKEAEKPVREAGNDLAVIARAMGARTLTNEGPAPAGQDTKADASDGA